MKKKKKINEKYTVQKFNQKEVMTKNYKHLIKES